MPKQTAMARGGEGEKWRAELLLDELVRCSRGGAMGRRQSRQHRIRFNTHVCWDSRSPINRVARGAMTLVPGGKRSDGHARIDRDHRRVRSIVSRTISSVRGGSLLLETAESPFFRLVSFMGVGTASISTSPSRSDISIPLPGTRPARSRMSFGITTRPAASMVVLMASEYHRGQAGGISASGFCWKYRRYPAAEERNAFSASKRAVSSGSL